MNSETLPASLVQKAVITIRDLQKIRDYRETKQSEQILFHVARGGEEALKGFISALREDENDKAHTELGEKLRKTLAFENSMYMYMYVRHFMIIVYTCVHAMQKADMSTLDQSLLVLTTRIVLGCTDESLYVVTLISHVHMYV